MSPSDVRERIIRDHDRLRAKMVALEEAVAGVGELAGSRDELLQNWIAFLRELREHLDLEDRILVPALREVDAWGNIRAERLAREHAAQRVLLEILIREAFWAPPGPAAVASLLSRLAIDMASEERELLHPDLLRDDIVAISLEDG